MEIFYTLVDNKGLTFKINKDEDGCYDLKEVSLNNAVLFKTKHIAEAELVNLERIMNNLDYYELYMDEALNTPFRVMGVKTERTLFYL